MTDDEPAEPTSARPGRARERQWGNAAAGFSAACALAVSAYTALLQRQQVKAQVWPILSWGVSAADKTDADPDGGAPVMHHEFAFNLRNDGVGPAIVRSMEVTLDGKPLRDWGEAMDALYPKPIEEPFARGAHYTVIHGRVFAAGASVDALAPNAEELTHRFYDEYERIAVNLCYCSVLDDCWLLHAQGLKVRPEPEPVHSCPRFPVPFEQ